MVESTNFYNRVIVALLVVAVLFSLLSIVISMNIRDNFKSDYKPVSSTPAVGPVGVPNGEVGLQVVSSPGASSP